MKSGKKAAIGLAIALGIGGGAAGISFVVHDADAYVATVNGEKVGRRDYQKAMAQAKKQYQARFGVDFNKPEGQQMLTSLQRGVIDELTERQLLLTEAAKRGLTASDDEIQAKLAEVKRQFPDEAAYKKALSDFGMNESDLQGQVRSSVVVEKLMREVTKDLKVSDAKVAEHYQKNRSQYSHAEEVSASHILVKVDSSAKDAKAEDARARALAAEVLAKAKAGADFAELAREHSDDPGSKQQGGDLGFFGKGRMVPEFEKAAFGLKEGELSGLVKTQFGYHILKRGEYRPARVDSLETVAPQIREQLLMQERNGAFQAWLQAEKKKAAIVLRHEFKSAPAAQSAPAADHEKATDHAAAQSAPAAGHDEAADHEKEDSTK